MVENVSACLLLCVCVRVCFRERKEKESMIINKWIGGYQNTVFNYKRILLRLDKHNEFLFHVHQ